MSAKASKAPRNWPRLSGERLLELRICDLGLRIEGSPLSAPLKQLYRELEQKALRFCPHVWLSDEWFCPDGIPGFGIPFFWPIPVCDDWNANSCWKWKAGIAPGA